MLPIRDLNPSRRTALINWSLVAVTAAIFFFVQSTATDVFQPDEEFLYQSAAIPCEVTTGEPLSLAEIRDGQCQRGDGDSVFPDKNIWFAILASIFFHGSVGHLLANMWVLIIFGNNIEDAFGHVNYLIFYVMAGLVAAAAHIFIHGDSTIPVVGASGAIAGVMGAYAVLYPRATVMSIVPPFFFWPFSLPAILFLGLWFVSQFFLAGESTNIAWEAHVGGFLFGIVVSLVLRRPLLHHSTRDPAYHPAGRLARY
ncbi:MAG TPA: rhomboid family intramembrane serine protease [Acidimicrobiia bacterium]|nr:rhomboid family intramembrane serine protease [Acidimicrobiia bacterium]